MPCEIQRGMKYSEKNPYKLGTPVWNGGKSYVTLSIDKVFPDGIWFEITYEDDYGNRVYPGVHYLGPGRARQMPIVWETWGECVQVFLK